MEKRIKNEISDFSLQNEEDFVNQNYSENQYIEDENINDEENSENDHVFEIQDESIAVTTVSFPCEEDSRVNIAESSSSNSNIIQNKMNWRNNSKIYKLLEKSALETLLKVYFQRVYGKEEVQQMENGLKNALEKYSKKELIYEKLYDENNEIEAEPLMNECLDALCEKNLTRARDHTPQTLLMLAQLFIRIGDYRLACEIIWCSAAISIQDFIRLRGLEVSLNSHDRKRRFVQSLSHEEIRLKFTSLEYCHTSFYTNRYVRRDVDFALKDANEFIQLLQTLELTDEKRQELENINFDF